MEGRKAKSIQYERYMEGRAGESSVRSIDKTKEETTEKMEGMAAKKINGDVEDVGLIK